MRWVLFTCLAFGDLLIRESIFSCLFYPLPLSNHFPSLPLSLALFLIAYLFSPPLVRLPRLKFIWVSRNMCRQFILPDYLKLKVDSVSEFWRIFSIISCCSTKMLNFEGHCVGNLQITTSYIFSIILYTSFRLIRIKNSHIFRCIRTF